MTFFAIYFLSGFSNLYHLDGNDPATVEKSMPNFVNYGKQNRESLAELFITLLLKVLGACWELFTSIRRDALFNFLRAII